MADELRRRILDGDLADRSVLPTEDELLVEIPISKPSLREAIGILDAEGLLSVRRSRLEGSLQSRPPIQKSEGRVNGGPQGRRRNACV